MFLLVNYSFLLLTLYLIVVLVLGDRNIRRKRPIRHFLVDTGEDLVGDKLALVFVLFAGLGYFITSALSHLFASRTLITVLASLMDSPS